MFYKGILFDLDDTIYDYKNCNQKALHCVIHYIINNNEKIKDYNLIKNTYNNISSKLKYELSNTASCHNKSIYIKHLLEELNIDLSLFSILTKIYWENFYDNMKCFDGIKEFILWNKKLGIKIGILSDYETEYQLIKLEKLDLLKYIDCIITSEEIGIEKPSFQMFYRILDKMKLNSYDVIMIGDNHEKDIKGSNNLKMLSYLFDKNNEKYFVNLHNNFNNIYNELIILKKISKYCGERFDLVQAGGGNISIKVEDLMFIKSSGYNLSTIDENNGYVVIDNKILLKDIQNYSVKEVTNYNFIGNKRASIETYMHSILKKYTVHLHPIQINKVLIATDAISIIKEIYPKSLIIEYLTPGIKVCNKIKEIYNDENVIFLINHGIIITSNNINEIYQIIHDVLEKFELYQKINFDKYKYTNKISNIINETFNINNISYLIQDELINTYFIQKTELFTKNITLPDTLIYCGIKILFGIENIQIYKKLYDESPKIIIENNSIYINSHSLSKCKEIEEVFKANLIVLDTKYEKNYLSNHEICFLNNWDSEKYRKLL